MELDCVGGLEELGVGKRRVLFKIIKLYYHCTYLVWRRSGGKE